MATPMGGRCERSWAFAGCSVDRGKWRVRAVAFPRGSAPGIRRAVMGLVPMGVALRAHGRARDVPGTRQENPARRGKVMRPRQQSVPVPPRTEIRADAGCPGEALPPCARRLHTDLLPPKRVRAKHARGEHAHGGPDQCTSTTPVSLFRRTAGRTSRECFANHGTATAMAGRTSVESEITPMDRGERSGRNLAREVPTFGAGSAMDGTLSHSLIFLTADPPRRRGDGSGCPNPGHGRRIITTQKHRFPCGIRPTTVGLQQNSRLRRGLFPGPQPRKFVRHERRRRTRPACLALQPRHRNVWSPPTLVRCHDPLGPPGSVARTQRARGSLVPGRTPEAEISASPRYTTPPSGRLCERRRHDPDSRVLDREGHGSRESGLARCAAGPSAGAFPATPLNQKKEVSLHQLIHDLETRIEGALDAIRSCPETRPKRRSRFAPGLEPGTLRETRGDSDGW